MTEFHEDTAGRSGWRAPRSSAFGDELDELLGLDPPPQLSAAARARLRARLAEAGDEEAGDDALYEVLALDEVEVPADLAARVLAGVRADRRRRRFRPVALVAAAAAASLLAAVGAGWLPLGRAGSGGAEDVPGEELLAALPFLESLEFLERELDPLEQEVVLAIDPREALLLEFLELGG